jgi:hypothetical protein
LRLGMIVFPVSTQSWMGEIRCISYRYFWGNY